VWLPCNFGEKVIAREFMTGKYMEYYFIGITKGCFNKIDYLFTKNIECVHLDLCLEDEDKITWGKRDVHNDMYLKQDSIRTVQVDLKIGIDQWCTYKDVFDTKSGKSGRLSSIVLKEDGYHYTFLEHNLTPVTFITEKLLVKEVEIKEHEEG